MRRVYFRHEKPRRGQKEFIRDVAEAIETEKHLLIHAPTGSGKSDCSLGPALSIALEEGLDVFFLTPKISQHAIVVDVLEGLGEKFDLSFRAVDLVGKRNNCLDPMLKNSDASVFYDLCARKKKSGECCFYENVRPKTSRGDLNYHRFLLKYGRVKPQGELAELCLKNGEMCPYETSIRAARDSQILVCDYHHMFNPWINNFFLSRTRKLLKESIVIVDEAHNLPERVRSMCSTSIAQRTIDRALEETTDPETKTFLKDFSEELYNIGTSVFGKEAALEKQDLRLKWDELFAEKTRKQGIDYLEETGKHRSHLVAVANFLESWTEAGEESLLLVKKNPLKIQVKCLDPGGITGPIIQQTHNSILMSGTLVAPEMYRDLLGLDPQKTMIRSYSSSFPKKNRLNLVVRGVSTQYKLRCLEQYNRISQVAARIINNTPGNVAVFFPSYDVMEKCFPGLEQYSTKPVLSQEPGANPHGTKNLLEKFKTWSKKGGAVLLGVAGGSLAEGIDLPKEQLLAVVVVGIPLAEMNIETQALINYYDKKYGRGWDYGYTYPAISRALQAAGRCIRTEKDRGVIAFLDDRYGWKNYSKLLPKDLSPTLCTDPGPSVEKFWTE